MNIAPRTGRSMMRGSKSNINLRRRRNRVYQAKRSKKERREGFEGFWNNLERFKNRSGILTDYREDETVLNKGARVLSLLWLRAAVVFFFNFILLY